MKVENQKVEFFFKKCSGLDISIRFWSSAIIWKGSIIISKSFWSWMISMETAISSHHHEFSCDFALAFPPTEMKLQEYLEVLALQLWWVWLRVKAEREKMGVIVTIIHTRQKSLKSLHTETKSRFLVQKRQTLKNFFPELCASCKN